MSSRKNSPLRSLLILVLLAGLLLSVFPAGAAGPITRLTLTRFVCAGPSFDLLLSGVFASDDGGGSDVFQVRVVDGVGTVLYDAVGAAAASPDTQHVVISQTDTAGTMPDPLANPIRITIYEHDGANMAGVLAAEEFSVSCLGQGLLTGDVLFVAAPGTVPTTPDGLPVLAPPPGPPLQPPLAPENGLPVIAQYSVNMRTRPNRDFPAITIIGQNTPLTLLGRTKTGFWVLARDPLGQTGWIVTGAQSANLLQIATLPPVQ